MPAGRTCLLTPELADTLCERIASGRSLVSICKEDDMPSIASVFSWLSKGSEENPEPPFKDLLDKYVRAREIQAELYATEIIDIADDGANDTYRDDEGNIIVDHDVLGRSKLRVDARKWIVSKLLPKKYGERQNVEVSHKGAIACVTVDLHRISQLIDQAATGREAGALATDVPSGLVLPAPVRTE